GGATRTAVRARAPRRGTFAAVLVGVAVVWLYVTLQPVEQPDDPVAAAPTSPGTTTAAPITTGADPTAELCSLAQELVSATQGSDVATGSRLAELFYDRAAHLVARDVRPEYEAAVRYYTEFNDLGASYGYDLIAALASPDGERWRQLTF